MTVRPDLDARTEEFERHRSYLLGVGYRMLGGLAEAEDAVQEAWLRWDRTDREEIRDARGWLVRVTGRICLDMLRARRARPESYAGPWLPEPWVGAPAEAVSPGTGGRDERDPAEVVAADDTLRLALVAVLERLTAEQRVAFVLHEAFGVPYADVADVLGTSEPAARQLAARARQAVRRAEPRRSSSVAEQRALLSAFLEAATRGDLEGLLRLLAPQVTLRTDGGGVVKAARRVIEGADKVARFLAAQVDNEQRLFVADLVMVNGEPGAVLGLRDGSGQTALVAVLVIDAVDGRVGRIDAVLNPDKLTRVPAPPAP